MNFSMRRLVKDHASLRASLPPNYLFPSDQDTTSIPEDLTQLLVLITGAEDTPYSQGLWRLHLKIPIDYPRNPPKATFRTRIYHPNVDEKTGAVCLETLKRDWDPKLTLRDILITISCLLIQPNPDSALNGAAGALIQENYEAFSKQAKLMTSIHAPIPRPLKGIVAEAKRVGEEIEVTDDHHSTNRPVGMNMQYGDINQPPSSEFDNYHDDDDDDDDDDEPISESESSKENNPLLSPSPVSIPPSSSRKSILGKHPLTEVILPVENDSTTAQQWNQNMTCSETNTACAATTEGQSYRAHEPVERPPQFQPFNALDANTTVGDSEQHNQHQNLQSKYLDLDIKENIQIAPELPQTVSVQGFAIPSVPSTMRSCLRNVSNFGPTKIKVQPRVGIRRL